VLLLAAGLGLAGERGRARGDDRPGDPGHAARLAAMRAIADRVTVQDLSQRSPRKLERLAEPVYRFDDPARRFSDGTVWAWGRSGRPAALLSLAPERSLAGNQQWVVELTSLADGAVSADGAGPRVRWNPPGAGVVVRPFSRAPAPADTEAKRLRQMKELARRFKVYEFFPPSPGASPERYELRLLIQPVHRYSDPASGLLDGALFVIAYGTNPEVVLVVESRRAGSSEPAWVFGLNRISAAELHVELDGRDVWAQSRNAASGPNESYWVFGRPFTLEGRPAAGVDTGR
jgi:hypothetical protein